MCGIGALLDPAGTLPPEAARRMLEALRHRGPDGEAVNRFGPLTLVHTRLAIVDVEGGDQPLYSEDRERAVVVNGEIYNQLDVRAELERAGHRFATRSDCEVVVHAYEDDGPDCVRRLNGMFAFALWDGREQRLVAARDHFGVKPLYWWSDGRRLALASEIGALLATGLVEPRDRRGGARPLPRVPLRAGAADALRGDQQAARGVAAGGRSRRPGGDHELPRGAGRAVRRPRGGGARRRARPTASATPSSAR